MTNLAILLIAIFLIFIILILACLIAWAWHNWVGLGRLWRYIWHRNGDKKMVRDWKIRQGQNEYRK